jgi:hypothetical protein
MFRGESHGYFGVPTSWRTMEGNTGACRYREARLDPARSETPSTHGINSHGNREIPSLADVMGTAARILKPQGERR